VAGEVTVVVEVVTAGFVGSGVVVSLVSFIVGGRVGSSGDGSVCFSVSEVSVLLSEPVSFSLSLSD
jgi:tetrahydromethanopterin S-methyltransferase subunit D